MSVNFNNASKGCVWIDLDNSPHVPFFYPIIHKLKKNNYPVLITARNCFQTCGLADYYGLKYVKVGKHYGKNKVLKVVGTFLRAFQLMPIAYKAKPLVAVCHGSRAMILIANTFRIPSALIMDYEFSQSLPIFRSQISIFPEIVLKNGYLPNVDSVLSYPGIKEDVYVPFFKPDSSILEKLKLFGEKIIVTIRPPATEAHYHNPESEILFSEVIDRFRKIDNLIMVILPRNEIRQTAWIKARWPKLIELEKIVIPDSVVDGLNLIWHSDLVVSGGGTMNREAAALGVPVYSIFRGRIGAVDRYLESSGRLTLLSSKEDVRSKIKICKRDKKVNFQNAESPALHSIMAALYSFIDKHQGNLKSK